VAEVDRTFAIKLVNAHQEFQSQIRTIILGLLICQLLNSTQGCYSGFHSYFDIKGDGSNISLV